MHSSRRRKTGAVFAALEDNGVANYEDPDVERAFRKYMRELGARGGAVSKALAQRDDPDYYRHLGRKGGKAAVAARKAKIARELAASCEPQAEPVVAIPDGELHRWMQPKASHASAIVTERVTVTPEPEATIPAFDREAALRERREFEDAQRQIAKAQRARRTAYAPGNPVTTYE